MGALNSAATVGVGLAIQIFAGLGNLETVSTSTLLAAATAGSNALLPYYATAQGGRGVVHASDSAGAGGTHDPAGPRDPRIGVDDVHVRRPALDRARAAGRLGSDHPAANHRPLRSVGEAPNVALATARVERARWGSALPGQRAGSIKDFWAARALEEPRESPRTCCSAGGGNGLRHRAGERPRTRPRAGTLLLPAPSLTGFKLPLPLTLRDAR